MAKSRQQDKRSKPRTVKQSGKAGCPEKQHVRRRPKRLEAKQDRACRARTRGKMRARKQSTACRNSMPTQKEIDKVDKVHKLSGAVTLVTQNDNAGQGQWKPEETGSEETRDLTSDYQDELQNYINSLQDREEEFVIDFDPRKAYVSNDRGTQGKLPPNEIPEIPPGQNHWPDAPPPPDALGFRLC